MTEELDLASMIVTALEALDQNVWGSETRLRAARMIAVENAIATYESALNDQCQESAAQYWQDCTVSNGDETRQRLQEYWDSTRYLLGGNRDLLPQRWDTL